MSRAVPWSLFLLLAAIGCQMPPEPLPLRPLPEAPPLSYVDVVDRVRLQVNYATEAFYVDGWTDVAHAARGLEQSARFLQKATEVPASHKAKLPADAVALGKEAAQLRQAAEAKNVRQVNDSLQQLHLSVRNLRASP